MLAADGDLVVFADADMATPPDQLPLLVAALADHDVALGSRIQPDGSDMRATQPGYRRLLGKAFHLLASVWVVGPVQDTQCGFKGFTPRRRAGPVRAAARHEHRVRRRAHLPRAPARLPDGDRADPLVRQARLADARAPGPRAARRLGPVPDPAHPSRQSPERRGTRVMDRDAIAPARRGPRCRSSRCCPSWPASALTLAVAGDTLGYDFLAYHQAAERLLDGRPLYDMSYTETGGFGLFYYPPTFAPLLLPFGLLPAATATWTWIGLSLVAFLVGVAILPVSRSVRWWIVLLAGLVVPVRVRGEARPGRADPVLRCSPSAGAGWTARPAWARAPRVGAAIKLQPGLSSSGRC